ncbi:MAG TPA: tocopherol cyclase family protein [Candidatus Hydrogenedentes bacterium]|mgnify:FL=1|nr:tocopherol cyclase family protein [Candidatus Hydrogenedentota bacterium]HOV74562.1 tocopherol cyclase family protein [Candidatus Hydrogenedentota bacterium]
MNARFTVQFILVVFVVLAMGCSVAPYNALIWNRNQPGHRIGLKDKGPWFEWWYYKVVLPDTGDAFYFVYGVVNPWDEAQNDPASRSYVGVGNFGLKESATAVFSVSDFQASYEKTDIWIAGQHATDSAIAGSLQDDDGQRIEWNITIDHRWSYNAMGWAMFVPEITNIGWYPAQADARFSGTIEYKGRTYILENAPGYQDRNWGRTFPSWWAWICANHFDHYPDTALASGGGHPILFGRIDSIEGMSVGLRHEGRDYSFRPNDGDRERVEISFGVWEIEAVNRKGHRINISAWAPCDSFMDLVFVTPQGDSFHDFETLTGQVTVKLDERDAQEADGWRRIAELHSDLAGIEYGSSHADVFDCFAEKTMVLYDNFSRGHEK